MFSPGVGTNLSTLLATSSYPFHMSSLIQGQSYNVTTSATVVALLISGTYGQADSEYLAINITGTRTFVNSTTRQISKVGPLLLVNSVYDNQNYILPFNTQQTGTLGGSDYNYYDSAYSGVAYSLSPPALFPGGAGQQYVAAVSLFSVNTGDYQYSEMAPNGARETEVAGSVVFQPGSAFDLSAAENYTFAMLVQLVDPEFTVTITATLHAILVGGVDGTYDSSFVVTAINGTRTYSSGNLRQTSVITGLGAFEDSIDSNTNVFYPFNSPTDGTLPFTYSGLAYTVSPPATVYGNRTGSTLSIGYYDLAAYEFSEVVLAEVNSSPVQYTAQSVQAAIVGAVTFEPGYAFNLQGFLANNSYSFQLLATIQDASTFTVVISANVTGVLLDGAFGDSDSSFLAINITGTRTFINASTVQVSRIGPMLPTQTVQYNTNIFYPFVGPQSRVLDFLAYSVSPAATVQTTAGSTATATQLGLSALGNSAVQDVEVDWQYVEHVGGSDALSSGTISAAAFATAPGGLHLASLLPSPVEKFSLSAQLSVSSSSYHVTIAAALSAVPLGGGAYLATTMVGSRTFSNSSYSQTSVITGLAVFEGSGSNTNVFFPASSSPLAYYYEGLGFTVSPPAVFDSTGANTAYASTLGSYYETDSYIEYVSYTYCEDEYYGGTDCYNSQTDVYEEGSVVFSLLSPTTECTSYAVDASSTAAPSNIRYPACASDLYSYDKSFDSTRLWSLGGYLYDDNTILSTVYTSTDGFTSINTSTLPGVATLYSGAAYLANRNLLYISGKADFNSDAGSWSSRVLVSSDQGVTFSVATAVAPFTPRSDMCSTAVPQTLIAIICGGQGYYSPTGETDTLTDCWLSSDGRGAVWTQQTAALPPSTIVSTPCVALFDAQPEVGLNATLVLTGNGAAYYISTDYARTFTEYGAPWSSNEALYSQMVTDVDSYVYLSNSQSSTLWFSSDKAQSWRTIPLAVTTTATSLSYDSQNFGSCLGISYVHNQQTGAVSGKRLVIYSGQLDADGANPFSIQGFLLLTPSCPASQLYIFPCQ